MVVLVGVPSYPFRLGEERTFLRHPLLQVPDDEVVLLLELFQKVFLGVGRHPVLQGFTQDRGRQVDLFPLLPPGRSDPPDREGSPPMA